MTGQIGKSVWHSQYRARRGGNAFVSGYGSQQSRISKRWRDAYADKAMCGHEAIFVQSAGHVPDEKIEIRDNSLYESFTN